MNIDSMAARAQILLHAHAARLHPRTESSQKALGAARNYHSDATYLIIIGAGESERRRFLRLLIYQPRPIAQQSGPEC